MNLWQTAIALYASKYNNLKGRFDTQPRLVSYIKARVEINSDSPKNAYKRKANHSFSILKTKRPKIQTREQCTFCREISSHPNVK